MKRRSPVVQLSEHQQLAVALLLVILVACSVFYCVGFFSTAVLQNWEDAALPLEENGFFLEEMTIPWLEPTPRTTGLPQGQ